MQQGEPVADPYLYTASVVARSDIEALSHGKSLTIGIFDASEQKIPALTHLEGAMDATIRVIVEWRAMAEVTDKPSTVCNVIHAEILRRIMEDETLGGLARNVLEVGNEFNIEDFKDRQLDGVIFLNIIYKHAKRDPRADAF
jgi:hypothetical protein